MKIQRYLMLPCLFFLLNLLWEFLHYPLYNDFSGMAKAPRLFIASFFDMIILSLIFLAVSIKNRDFKWVEKPGKTDYAIIISAGLLTAAFIEKAYIAAGEWSYKKMMPTIFGVGLSPLIQLFATMIISLWAFNLFKNKR